MKIRKILFYLLVAFGLFFSFNMVTSNQCYANEDGSCGKDTKLEEGDTLQLVDLTFDEVTPDPGEEGDTLVEESCDSDLDDSAEPSQQQRCFLPCSPLITTQTLTCDLVTPLGTISGSGTVPNIRCSREGADCLLGGGCKTVPGYRICSGTAQVLSNNGRMVRCNLGRFTSVVPVAQADCWCMKKVN